MSSKRGRVKPPHHQPYEAINPKGKFYKVSYDKAKSPAWLALTPRQRDLYHFMMLEIDVKTVDREVTKTNAYGFKFPYSTWKRLYADGKAFKRDYEALIEKGFIEIVSNGKTTRTPNIYAMSVNWKMWGVKDGGNKRKERSPTTVPKAISNAPTGTEASTATAAAQTAGFGSD